MMIKSYCLNNRFLENLLNDVSDYNKRPHREIVRVQKVNEIRETSRNKTDLSHDFISSRASDSRGSKNPARDADA